MPAVAGAAPGPVSSEQIAKAVTALQKYVGRQQGAANALLEDDEILYLQIALKKVPQQARKDKPIRM